jgi:hypothetical protein
MLAQKMLRRACQSFSILFLAFLATLLPSQSAHGQGLELGGGWTYMTGDGGTNGFGIDGAWWFTKRVTLAANYDSAWDNSNLTTFAFTPVGDVVVKSHLQNFLVGPRIFFSTNWTSRHKLNPFGELQFGASWLNQAVNVANVGEHSASDASFTWELGGGAEYLFNPHWSGRLNLDLLRTHFVSEGQSHLRLALAVTYTFGPRGEAAH